MFDINTDASALEEEIARVHAQLNQLSAADKEYEATINQLSKLYALKNTIAQLSLQAQKDFAAHQLAEDVRVHQDELDQRPFYKRVSPDTALTVAGSLLTALFVIKYEERSVISTKALSFMRKF